MTLAQCSLIRALWAQGLDTYDISKRVDVSEAEVYNYITGWRSWLRAIREREQA